MFHGILGGIGGTIQWCLILAIILVLFYISCSILLKLCRGKCSGSSNAPKAPLPTPTTDSDPTQNRLDNPMCRHEQLPTLHLVLASFTHDLSASQEKTSIVMPITISSQNDHIPCSALHNTGSPVTLLIEQVQHQLNLPAMPLKSHYHLVGVTGDILTTLGTVQVDIVLDHKIWPTPAIIMSSLSHPLILGLNFLKLTKSKIDFKTNNDKIGSEIYPADMHCINSSKCTIITPTSDVYQPWQLLLNKKACWMFAIVLIIEIALIAIAFYTHCHLKPPFKKQEESLASPAPNLT